MTTTSQHVSPRINGTWAVRATGALKAARVFTDQQEAIRYAKARGSGPIYIHGKNGLVMRKVLAAGGKRTAPVK